ncbi:MAG: glycosyltransferase family 4 protein [Candidatus Bathyarchaeia archaeon]
MKILWINHRDPKHPEAGGAEVHLFEVGRRLVKSGHELTLLAEQFPGSAKEESLGGIKVKRMGNKYTLHALTLHYVKRKSYNYDVIIDDVAHAVPFWSFRFTSKPVVAIVHHVHQEVVNTELHFPLRNFVRFAERTLKDYKNIIAVSHTTKKDLIEKLGVESSKISVIYHGIDHQKFKPGSKFLEPTVLWIGRMKKYKNLEHVVKAFKLVKKAIPEARLMLVGRGEEERRIKLFVHENGINDVIFTSRVSESDKIRLLQGAWCVTYTSDVEGWGMAVLEAASCGTPAIAYSSGALKEAVLDGETGFLVKYGGVNMLAERIIEVLKDEELKETLSKNALKHSQGFDWDKTAEQTERYLEALL